MRRSLQTILNPLKSVTVEYAGISYNHITKGRKKKKKNKQTKKQIIVTVITSREKAQKLLSTIIEVDM